MEHVVTLAKYLMKIKQRKAIKQRDWCPMKFEEEAECIDQEDDVLSGDDQATFTKYTDYGRPYLVSCGYEEGVKFIFTMSPLMVEVLSSADFIQCDVTYDECTEYPYIFNAVAFNNISMVIGRLRLSKQSATAYSIAFKKLFSKCSMSNKSFVVGETLLGIVTDWSDAEINGLKLAVGNDMAERLLK